MNDAVPEYKHIGYVEKLKLPWLYAETKKNFHLMDTNVKITVSAKRHNLIGSIQMSNKKNQEVNPSELVTFRTWNNLPDVKGLCTWE